jgi:hypothetical protein
MSGLVSDFKDSCHLAAEVLHFRIGKLIHEFGLQDFLENCVLDRDDAPTIALKAIRYFCEDADRRMDVFKFAVMAVSEFLHYHYFGTRRERPIQAMIDLVDLLEKNANDRQIRKWVTSHFE